LRSSQDPAAELEIFSDLTKKKNEEKKGEKYRTQPSRATVLRTRSLENKRALKRSRSPLEAFTIHSTSSMWLLCLLKIRGGLYHSHCFFFFFFLLGNRGDPRNKLLVSNEGRNRASKRAKKSGNGYGACVFPVLPHGQSCRHGAAAQAGEETGADLLQGSGR
jgi:hypothetical protein